MLRNFVRALVALFSFLVLFGALTAPVSWAAGSSVAAPVKALTPYLDEAAAKAQARDFAGVAAELKEFDAGWAKLEQDVKARSPRTYEAVEGGLTRAKSALAAQTPDVQALVKEIQGIDEAIDSYSAKYESNATPANVKSLKDLTPWLDQALAALAANDWDSATAAYGHFDQGWRSVEDAVRAANPAAYGQIESKMTLVQAALAATPHDAKNATVALQALDKTVDAALAAPTAAHAVSTQGIQTLLAILNKAQAAVAQNDAKAAAAEMTEFIQAWPSVEGAVRVRSAQAYTDTENNMARALGLLTSTPPQLAQAGQVMTAMQAQLTPLTQGGGYTAWDAAIILLREGLEALLVLAALLAFLSRSGNADKRVWVWAGTGAGILASAALAFLFNGVLSAAVAGAGRELVEGITGLIAVGLLLTVGAWLHGKSNVKAWQSYINKQMGAALAAGRLWSLAVIAFLAVLREGAETIIFYLGLATAIQPGQLLLGIASAIVFLLVLGFVVVRMGMHLPVRQFFLGATVLIYYLAVKFTGQSIHALQVAQKLPAHVSPFLPSWEFIGLYPNWEGTLAQLVIVLIIAGSAFWVERSIVLAGKQPDVAVQTK